MKLADQEVKHRIGEIIGGKRLFHLQCSELNDLFIFTMPSPQAKLKADLIYDATFMQAVEREIPTRREMERMQHEAGVISSKDFKRIQSLEESVKTLKLMRSRSRSQKQVTELEMRITVKENLLIQIRQQHEKYYYHTAEAKAEQEKTVYLIRLGILSFDEKPYWSSLEEFKKDKRQLAQSILIREYLDFARGYDTKTIRFIARNKEWRIFWKACTKTGSPLFEGPVTSWDINKLLLTYWSDFYESIMGHPNSPLEEVINDDYKCDQWVEDQMRQVMSQDDGDITQKSEGGKVKVTRHVNEPYRVVTQKEFDAEQAEKAKIQTRNSK